MHCSKCNQELTNKANFCEACGTKVQSKSRRAGGMTFIALLLVLGGAIWFAGNYYVVRTDGGVDLVKKTAFSLENPWVSLDALKSIDPVQRAQQFPSLMQALAQDPRFADEFKATAQQSLENVKEAVASGVSTVTGTLQSKTETAAATPDK